MKQWPNTRKRSHWMKIAAGLLGRLYAKIGRRDEALAVLDRLRQNSEERYVSPYNFSIIYVGLGRKDEAIHFLEQTYEDGDGYNIAFLKIDPFLDPMRGDPPV